MNSRYGYTKAMRVVDGKAGPSFYVVRHGDRMLSYHATAKKAVTWLASHTGNMTMREAMDNFYRVTKAYTAEARFYGKNTGAPFKPEWMDERATDYEDALIHLRRWVHRSWEQERDAHPSPAGRAAAWERWNDVITLIRLAELTLLKQPRFNYDFGPMSPTEGLGNRLKLAVYPTPEVRLQELVSHRV